ncbi:hypothetical protein TOC8172_22750 [Pseudomonas syringae]
MARKGNLELLLDWPFESPSCVFAVCVALSAAGSLFFAIALVTSILGEALKVFCTILEAE